MNFDLKKIDAVVASQNEKLIAGGKKIYPVELTNNEGEKYTLDYVVEPWLIEKMLGRSSSYYRLHKTITNGVGKKIELLLMLSDEQVEYINYHNNNLLTVLGGKNTSLKQNIRTRLTYGVGSNGLPYIRCQVLISDRIRISDFISTLKTEMLLDSCSDSKTALDVILEKITPLEELDNDEVKML